MVPAKLIRLIESNCNEITTRVIAKVHGSADMPHTRSFVEAELREWCQMVLEGLGHWLSAGGEQELAAKSEQLGKLRFEENVPLAETVRALLMIRQQTVDFVEEHVLMKNALNLYAEEELERRLGRFFDLLTIHMVEGYERALRRAVSLTSQRGVGTQH